MSDTDSFIEEVTEEVRRDRLYALMRRYGWIAILAVVVLVGGAAYNEIQKARQRTAAEAAGDALLAALERDEPTQRIAALDRVEVPAAGAQAVVTFLKSAEMQGAGEAANAAAALDQIAVDGELPAIYRQIASYKATLLQGDTLSAADRQQRYEALIAAGSPLRLLAEEQIAMIEIENGDQPAAIARLKRVLADAEVSAGLRRRTSQLIVALGGDADAVASDTTPDQDG